MTLNDTEPLSPSKKSCFNVFFAISSCDTHFQMAGDRPGQPAYKIFSTKRRFTAASFDPLGSRRPAQANVKEWYP